MKIPRLRGGFPYTNRRRVMEGRLETCDAGPMFYSCMIMQMRRAGVVDYRVETWNPLTQGKNLPQVRISKRSEDRERWVYDFTATTPAVLRCGVAAVRFYNYEGD